ncbi:F-box protein skip27 [Thalictrum thalictroides]|uniref:F-box protein skip27 n=1 Tax=Thalictrum thalictroides TaxID=46969 RepID=A0A7J6X0C3_THATH|nr:F-box protein skip27 [Thalictrum thalictroides]
MVSLDSPLKTPLKKNLILQRRRKESNLESLPQDILIKILCSVDHDDLKELFQVSESIRQATLIVKRDHFAFSTPSKRLEALRSFSKLEMMGRLIEDGSDEAPNAPKQQRNKYRNRVDRKKLADISVALFSSPDKQWRTNRILQF